MVGALAPVNGSDPPISTYTVDDGSPVVFTASSNVTQTQYGQTFFLQQSLFASEHTLVINVTRASAQTPFLFDYIGFIPISSPTNSLAPSGIPSPSPSTVAGYDNKGSPPPFGPIVGGVVGGLALLVFVGLGLFFLFGRRRDGQPYFSGTAEVGGMGGQGALSCMLLESNLTGRCTRRNEIRTVADAAEHSQYAASCCTINIWPELHTVSLCFAGC